MTQPVDGYPYFANDGYPLAMAHRGGAVPGEHSGLENSMRAFQDAVDRGYRYLETDVHATADGALVAFHDATVDRTTDGSGRIADLAYRDVQRCLIGGREPIPTLDDLLGAWPDVQLNIDCKSARAVDPLVRMIEHHHAWERVCLASFSSVSLARLRRRLDPRVATALGPLGVATARFLPTAGLRRTLLGGAGQAAQVPVYHRGLRVVTPDFVERMHALGKQVHVWTIDDPDQMRELLDLGVDGIISDRIDLLRDVLRSRGLWAGRGDSGRNESGRAQ